MAWPKLNRQIADQRAQLAQRSTQSQNAAVAQRALLNQMNSYNGLLGIYPPTEPAFKPSAKYPNTLGWRTWVWDLTTNELRSPIQATAWNGTELRCETWDESEVIRGAAGIHAHLVPNDWHKLAVPETPNGGKAYAERRDGSFRACVAIQGVVERFGRFVLGTEGWRAEWVQIRQLAAPTDQIGLALEKAFPDVEIIYGNR